MNIVALYTTTKSYTDLIFVEMTLDISYFKHFPTDHIPGFKEQLLAELPELEYLRNQDGGNIQFTYHLDNGIHLAYVVEQVTLALLTAAGIEYSEGFTKLLNNKDSEYNITFSCRHNDSGLYAATAAVRLVEALVYDLPYDVDIDIEALKIMSYTKKCCSCSKSCDKDAVIKKVENNNEVIKSYT